MKASEITLWDGRVIPRIGVGCWPIGGQQMGGNTSFNYAGATDKDSIAGLRAAYEMGARLFDTAAAYGYGHSEELLGEVFEGSDDLVIVTKFGHHGDIETRQGLPQDLSASGIETSIDASRRRLRKECLDLVLLHISDLSIAESGPVFDTLESLVAKGKMAAFGWSTDLPDRVQATSNRSGFVSVECALNIFEPNKEILAISKGAELIALARSPLAMGLLGGAYSNGEKTGAGDIRSEDIDWLRFFKLGVADSTFVRKVEAVRDLLVSDGRSLSQGALAWAMAQGTNVIPIPGFKSEAQVRENLGALERGLMSPETVSEIDAVLART